MAAAPDWSQLPAELLHLILECLDDTPLDRLRFRSVCSTWRSSISPFIPIHQFPFNFPPIPAASLSARSIFLIKPPPHLQTQTPWLVKIGQDECGRNRLWHPLFRDRSISTSSPGVLDLTNLLVSDLGNEFVVAHPSTKGKVVAAAAATLQGSMLLTIHESEKLAVFGYGDGDDERWTIMPAPDMSTNYHDVSAFNGRLYAVESGGRTVVVGPDSVLEEEPFAEHYGPNTGCCYNEKFLVESEGELLLVEKHGGFCEDIKYKYEGDNDIDEYKEGMFRVFRFGENEEDEEENESWVHVRNVRDRVLFIGDDCAFSVSASDLGVDEGNYVVFRDDDLKSGIGVFPLDDVGWYGDGILHLLDYPGFSSLFRPPPDWAMLH
ncbi:F-box protein SKIP23-like [Lotus japonicus]|uniref:F-box protein SKIP23-like n=1 Tax=Lotus japonicus TaxID=34305 RepID=UPI00258EF701|nr:F-box protein SKIP23-like [Lotus japonicus]